jgi:hypothetical protein
MSAFLNSAKGLVRSFVGTMPPAEMDVDEPLQKKSGLFAQCSFVVVRSAKLGNDEAEKVTEHTCTLVASANSNS